MHPRDEDRLDEAIARFASLIRAMEQRQSRIEARLASLYQLTFVAFGVVVASIAFLTIILSSQAPEITAALTAMNGRFAEVSDDMVRMERTVRTMGTDMKKMPVIVAKLDRMHGSVSTMSYDLGEMAGTIGEIDDQIAMMGVTIGDMRQSFQVMEQTVGRMGVDVHHMSQPMRMFNWMNPFR